MDGIGVIPWIEPGAGLFLWCKLPNGIDAADVARRGLADDVLFWEFHALQRRDDGGSQNPPRSPKRNERMRPNQTQLTSFTHAWKRAAPFAP
jgi:DNA-binding transcriptional MocR family regulator